MSVIQIKPLGACLEETEISEEHWLWCLECERFFHLHSVRTDGAGVPCCPFSDCHGYGFDSGLLFWNTARSPEDERWPASASGLRHGMRSPDLDAFHRACRDQRIAVLIEAFEDSPEHRDLDIGPSRYVRPLLILADDLCWDLTDDEDPCFLFESARLILGELPARVGVSDGAEAPRMLAELRALFAFAARTGAIRDAVAWSHLLAGDPILELLQDTMRSDPRLRGGAPGEAVEKERTCRAGSHGSSG